jgi:hypothetical protein
MWVILRLVAAAITFIIRRWYVINPPKWTGELDGVPYYVKIYRGRYGGITGFKIGLPLEAPAFSLLREGAIDRFFKKINFSREYQTSDAEFDRDIYIECDHSGVCAFLSAGATVREHVLAIMLRMSFTRIDCNGSMLWLKSGANREPLSDELSAARALQQSLGPLATEKALKVPDPFFWRALLIESGVWSIFAYAVGGFVENMMHHEDYHLDSTRLMEYGLVMGVTMFIVLVTVLFLDLHRSSRGHRVLVECAFLLLLGFPGAGVQAVSDMNRSFDNSEPVRVTRTIENLERHVHRGRNSTWYSYHMFLSDAGSDPYAVPAEIEITQELFDRASVGSTAVLNISDGWLGLPWYRSIEVE